MNLRITAAICFLVVALTALFIGVGYYSNGLESLQSLYITVNGAVAKAESTILIPSTSEVEFKLKSAGIAKTTDFDYSILIYANTESDLTYTADGFEYLFAQTGDLTDCFEIEKGSNSFTLNGLSSIESVLSKLHNGKTIVLTSSAPRFPFILSIIDNDKQAALSYYLGLAPSSVTSVILNPSELIFGSNGVVSVTPVDPENPSDPAEPSDPGSTDEPEDPIDDEPIEDEPIEDEPEELINYLTISNSTDGRTTKLAVGETLEVVRFSSLSYTPTIANASDIELDKVMYQTSSTAPQIQLMGFTTSNLGIYTLTYTYSIGGEDLEMSFKIAVVTELTTPIDPDDLSEASYKIYIDFMNANYHFNFNPEYPERVKSGEEVEVKLYVEDYVQIGLCSLSYEIDGEFYDIGLNYSQVVDNYCYIRFVMPASDVDLTIKYDSEVEQL